jgi:catechol 2,3-dioxygenase-like lactoylglutathione lyase family enzyme
MTIQFQSPVLLVKDIAVSRYFYERLLGQTVDMDFGPNVGFKGFAIWQVDHASQIIFERPPKSATQLGQENLELYFETDTLENVWASLAAANTPVVHPLREQPWGQRVFRVYDPDGHIVEIAEPMPVVIGRLLAQGMTPAAVAERTGMPLAIVEQVAVAST